MRPHLPAQYAPLLLHPSALLILLFPLIPEKTYLKFSANNCNETAFICSAPPKGYEKDSKDLLFLRFSSNYDFDKFISSFNSLIDNLFT